MKNKQAITTIRLTTAALFMALNILFSSFGIPVLGGHLYLCDMVICLAAILLNPLEAFVVGGVGSFLGDLLFYPAPMFVSLVTHGLQAVVISLISHKTLKNKPLASGIGVTIGAIIMVVGYTLGKIFVYSTFEYAMLKLPFEILQGALGAVLGMVLCWGCGIHKLFNRFIEPQDRVKNKESITVKGE
ncbi:ECF transporter S component [Butyrivibrio proteoclasticus]|uniref:ECF transporter S component n=1 Tax=Butyrivibrio proteoclasticus TaxID=43305 RepID=UPI000689073B|nr:ECF transporter S component [Butyrivibrio proteoclasticus]